ncbi:unnamed protein product [Candida verbasci]|uniref:F-box domain-containing protein n=1 Tax=Candida verbasci TaxID=1227364 RepID=A0A9W4TSV7_9ASCO|nr:unnamed protein product [Candida verbasci]
MNLQNNCESDENSINATNNFNDLINATTTKNSPHPSIKEESIPKDEEFIQNTEINELEPVSNEDVSVVTPFLVKHISDQNLIPRDNFHKYCYRHNPEITCNKSTDEYKMKIIQQKLEQLPNRDQEAISHVWSIFSAAPVHHRQLILQGILTQCCFPQLSYISQEVSQLIKIDFITTLPQELSLKILCYLDCKSLCNAAQVSRKWKSLADDDRVWHHMCEQHIDRKCPNCGWGLPLMHMKRAREMITEDEKDTDSQPPPKKIKTEVPKKEIKKRPWKSVYSERYQIEKRWRNGSYEIKTFIGHSDGVTCLKFNRKYLMTGSYDTTIKIWKIDTGECIRTLTGHTKGVRSLVFDQQKLITGGLDSTIKVWNYHTGHCIATYRGHDDAVVSVDFSNKSIVSGSADHTVRVWHVDSRTCYTLRGHTDWVNCVKIFNNLIFSASDDTTIRMWDLSNNQCLKIFGGIETNGHIGQVQSVIPFTYKEELIEDNSDEEDMTEKLVLPTVTTNGYPTHLLTSSLDNTIKLWDVSTGKCIRTQFGHIEGVWSIAADTFRIISGAHDNLIKVWDLQNGKCLHTFGNYSSVSCVELSDSRFVAGLESGDVKMYCFE